MNLSRDPDPDAWPIDVTPERLALLLDGRLPAEERERLLAALAHDPEMLAVLADASAALATPGGAITSRSEPWRVPPGLWVALAAGIVAVVAVPLGVQRWQDARVEPQAAADPVASYVAMLDGARSAPALELAPWSATRSIRGPTPVSALPWRIGARFVDLEIAVSARDSATSVRVATEVASLLEEAGVAAPTRAVFLDTAAMVREAAGAWRSQARRARADAVRSIGDDAVSGGAWIEAARYAAVRRDAAFFGAGRSRAAVGDLRRRGVLDAPAAALVLAAGARSSAADWVRLEALLREAIASR
jgi:hypothetical protein